MSGLVNWCGPMVERADMDAINKSIVSAGLAGRHYPALLYRVHFRHWQLWRYLNELGEAMEVLSRGR